MFSLGVAHTRFILLSQKSYDAEWGALDTEGNVWWPGSARAGWEDVIGIILTFTDRTDYAL
jgi:hypothetical protein